MRTIPLGAGAGSYYLDPVARGIEPPGCWVGSGASSLDLRGEVGTDALTRLLEGRSPDSGQRLRRPCPVRGFDITAAVPKSVSVLWALGGPEVAAAVEQARQAALVSAVEYLEQRGVQSNRGGASPLVAAAFGHRTSRAGDPYLHTHLVVLNLASDGASGWRALNSSVLAAQACTAGSLYQAELRHRLSKRLDLSWEEVRHGVAQLAAVPAELRELFSLRRAEVVAEMSRHGGHSPRSAQIAALATRPRHRPEEPAERVAPTWRARADRSGLAVGAVAPRREPQETPTLPTLAELGLEDLTSFSRRDVVEALCRTVREGASAAWIDSAADSLLRAGAVLAIDFSVTRSGDLARGRGHSYVLDTDRQRWTTLAAREAERRLEDAVRRQLGAGRARLDSGAGGDPPAGSTGPVAALLASGHGIELVDATVGPGQDEVLGSCRRAWEAAGIRVVGWAPEPEAAARLSSGSGVGLWTSEQVLNQFVRLRATMAVPTVLLVAGADGLGARRLAELAEAAERTAAKLVLIGEPDRLGRADHSGGWRAAARAAPVHRVERDLGPDRPPRPSRELREGADGARAEPVLRLGAVVAASGTEQLRQALVADWASRRPGEAVMVASRRSDRDDLNARARDHLLRQGVLVGGARLLGGLQVQAGDQVVVDAVDPASRRLGLRPGMRARVEGLGLRGPGGHLLPDAQLAGCLRLEAGYALGPYRAARSGAAELLVLGGRMAALDRPGAGGPQGAEDARLLSGAATYYIVAPAREAPARAAEIDPPAYLLRALGPVPSGRGRREWSEAAGRVEGYRSRWGITDPGAALGGPVEEGRQGAQRRDALAAIRLARERSGRARTQEGGRPGAEAERPAWERRSLGRELSRW